MKTFFFNINYFHQYIRFFYISFLQRNWWCQHLADVVSVFFFELTLKRLLNNCIKLYWYYTSSSWNLKERSKWTTPSRKKITLNRPSLIRVNISNLQLVGLQGQENSKILLKIQGSLWLKVLFLKKILFLCRPITFQLQEINNTIVVKFIN